MSKRLDKHRWLVELLSIILFLQYFESYYIDHIKRHHHYQKFATAEDADMEFLLLLGFYPGKSKEFYWQLLLKTIVSPRFHWQFLCARFVTNFITAPFYRSVIAVVWNAGLLGIVTLTHAWAAFLVAWLFPLTFLYQMSALLQFLSEHKWLLVGGESDEK